METGDLITSFFGNEMNPEQERQFLLSVASSDSMRLGLKSHVMLDKILVEQAEDMHVPDAIRSTIFTEAGVAAASSGVANKATTTDISRGDGSQGGFPRMVFTIAALIITFASFGTGYFVGGEYALQPAGELNTLQPATTETGKVEAGENATSNNAISRSANQEPAQSTNPLVTEENSAPGASRVHTATVHNRSARRSTASQSASSNGQVPQRNRTGQEIIESASNTAGTVQRTEESATDPAVSEPNTRVSVDALNVTRPPERHGVNQDDNADKEDREMP